MPRKRKKHWYTDFYFEGARVRQKIHGARTRHDAVKAETKIRNDLFQGKYGAPVQPVLKDKPLSAFIKEDFVPWAEEHKKQPRHYRSISAIWSNLPSLKAKTVRGVSQFDIESAKIARRKTISRYGHRVAPQTVNRELIIMSSLFHRACEWGYRENRADNPCRGVERLPVTENEVRFLSLDEELLLMPAAWDGPAYLPRMISLGIGTGLRQIEMRHLKKQDIDFARALLYVLDPKWRRDPRKTKGVPLSPEVLEMLREWVGMTTSVWVFPSPHDNRRPIGQPTVNQALNYASARAKLKGIGFHSLRHTFGTRLGDAGVRLEVIRDLMGHSKISTTLIYIHPSRDAGREAVRKVSVSFWSQKEKGKVAEKLA
ncbi:MAG: site-specific integrase [Acidobacteria bacterium]|nr:site-specific integrase [Acidobacteriota bacterium]